MTKQEADEIGPEDRDAAIARAREIESANRELRLRLEALQSGEILPDCEHCGSEFTARAGARFCSTRCRVAAHRANVKAGHSPANRQQDRQLNLVNEFRHYMRDLVWAVDALGPAARSKIIEELETTLAELEAE